MFEKLLRAWLWSKATSASRGGSISDSLADLDKIEKRFGLRPYEEVFKYTLLLRHQEYTLAEQEMEAFVRRNEKSSDGNTIYSRIYCEYVLNGIKGDLDAKRASKARALEVECSAGLKRWLPL
jgi:hypothetical protein